MAHEVWSLIDHKAAALHSDGVATAEVWVKVCAVIAALITPTLEVLVLVKDNLAESLNIMSHIMGALHVSEKREYKFRSRWKIKLNHFTF